MFYSNDVTPVLKKCGESSRGEASKKILDNYFIGNIVLYYILEYATTPPIE